jgi:hypothetical protein
MSLYREVVYALLIYFVSQLIAYYAYLYGYVDIRGYTVMVGIGLVGSWWFALRALQRISLAVDTVMRHDSRDETHEPEGLRPRKYIQLRPYMH